MMNLQSFEQLWINLAIPLALIWWSEGGVRRISEGNIKINLEYKESEDVEWIQLIQDRAKWCGLFKSNKPLSHKKKWTG
jgi:hypothetical protein